MVRNLLELLPLEREALLEALRRDLRSERNLAMLDSDWEIWHQRNVRLNLRLLEAINPKGRSVDERVCKRHLKEHANPNNTQTIISKSAEFICPRFILNSLARFIG